MDQPVVKSQAPAQPRKGGCGLLIFLLGLVAGGGALFAATKLGVVAIGTGVAAGPGSAGVAATQSRWHCPMHPTYTSDRIGDCPICGMKLVPIENGDAPSSHPPPAAATDALALPPTATEQDGEPWQCPTHPTYTAPEPGTCIICGEKLVTVPLTAGTLPGAGSDGQPVATGTGTARADVPGLAGVTIDPQRQQLIGLRTVVVTQGPVGHQWRTTGRVIVDETRVRKVNVRVDGFVETLHVDYIGRPVRKGEALLELYSPELVAAQREYLLALQTDKVLSASSLGEGGTGGKGGLAEAGRQKLKLLEFPASAIARLERSGQVQKTVTLSAPIAGIVTQKSVVQGSRLSVGDAPFEITDLSAVWLVADVYTSEIQQVTLGMAATLTLQGQPDVARTGNVTFVDPIADERSRTVRVRLSFSNADGQLRPGTYGEVVFAAGVRQGLLIPTDAVIDSGTEKVVFLAKPDGRFEPRKVYTAAAPGDQVEVTAGLAAGDRVVVRANFLIDSESRLKAALAVMAEGAAGGTK